MRKLTVAMALAAAALWAQTGQVGGPMIGFVFDSSAGVLRSIRGIPGASVLGDSLDIGYHLTSAAVAPKQDSAAVMGADGALHLFKLSSGTATALLCGACPAKPQAIAYSPSGTAVAFYTEGHVQVVTGLPDSASAGASFAVGSVSRGAGRGTQAPPIAVSDDGAYLLAGARDAAQLFNAQGGSQRLLETKPYPLVAFAAGGHQAAVADGVGSGLALFSDVSSTASPRTLAAADVIRKAVALAFSQDASRILLATAADQGVVSFDVSAGTRSVVSCNCTASELVPMGKVFRLNETGNGPLWLLDLGSADPRIVFVPSAN